MTMDHQSLTHSIFRYAVIKVSKDEIIRFMKHTMKLQ